MLVTSNENIVSEVDLFIVENRENLLNIREQALREFFTVYMYSNLENFSYIKSFEYGNCHLIFTGVIFKDIDRNCLSFRSDYKFILNSKNTNQQRQNEYTAQVSRLLSINFLFEKDEIIKAYDKNLFDYLCDKYKKDSKQIVDNLIKTSYKCIINTNSSIRYSTYKTERLEKDKNIMKRPIDYKFTIITDPDRFASAFVDIKFFYGEEPISYSIKYTGEDISLLCNTTLIPEFVELTEKKIEDLEDQVYKNSNFLEKFLIWISRLFSDSKEDRIRCI